MTQEPLRGTVFLLLAKWLKQLKALTSFLLHHDLHNKETNFRTHKMGVIYIYSSGVAGPRGLVILFNKIKVWYFSVSQNWT